MGVLSGRLNFYFGTKVLFSTSVSTTTNQGAQMVYFAFEHTDSSLFKQFRDVVLGYSHIESMWNKRSQPLRSVLDCEEPGEVEECIQVYLKTKSQVLVVSSKASTCSGNIARSDVFEPFWTKERFGLCVKERTMCTGFDHSVVHSVQWLVVSRKAPTASRQGQQCVIVLDEGACLL